MKRTLLALFDAIWLPALLILGTLWLYAPWANNARVDHLHVISIYEASGVPYAWLFRFGDIAAAILIWLAVWRTHLFKRHRWLAWMLVLVSILTLIDDIFVASGCMRQCSVWQNVSEFTHDIETTISLTAVAVAAAIDGFHNKQRLSQLFLAAQAITLLLIVTTVLDKQGIAFVQYLYQIITIAWIGFVLHRFMPNVRHVNNSALRTLMAILLFVGGCFEIVLAFHVRDYESTTFWLAEHGAVVGVILLYLSRQIYNGQRRAAVIVMGVLISQVIKYALITPHPYPLMFFEAMVIVLWLNWSSFNRNLGVPPIVSRLKSLWLVLGGIVAALLLVYTTASFTGHQRYLEANVQHLFSASARPISRAHERSDRLEDRFSRFRYVSASLGLALIVAIGWIVFRPSNSFKNATLLESDQIEALLEKYSTSSEDFFKVWPEDKTYFTEPGIEGFIAFKKVAGSIFCLADPICAPKNKQALLHAFTAECRKHGWSVCFFIFGDESKQLYETENFNVIKIGSSAVIPIDEFSQTTIRDKWWRWQMNRSAKTGTTYQVSQPPHNIELLEEVADVSLQWLDRAGHKEQGFALGYYDANYMQRCPLHLLRDETGALVAFANQLPTYSNVHQATVDLIRFKPDFNGAMPVLIAHLITSLAATDTIKTFDLGFVPLAKIDNKLVVAAKRLAASRFSAHGLEQFKGKFKPDWQPQYLAYDGDLVDLTAFISRLEKALKV